MSTQRELVIHEINNRLTSAHQVVKNCMTQIQEQKQIIEELNEIIEVLNNG